MCFASKTVNAGHVTSKMHVVELGAQPDFKQIWLDICYHKLSLLFVYDMETVTAVYRNQISAPISFVNVAYDSWQIKNVSASGVVDLHGTLRSCKLDKDCYIMKQYWLNIVTKKTIHKDNKQWTMTYRVFFCDTCRQSLVDNR